MENIEKILTGIYLEQKKQTAIMEEHIKTLKELESVLIDDVFYTLKLIHEYIDDKYR